MADRLFQCPFAHIIVKGRAGHAEEESQLFPVAQQVGDGLAQSWSWALQGARRTAG